VPTFANRGVTPGQRGGSPAVVNLSFLDRSRYFSFKSLVYRHETEWAPFQTHFYAENLVAPGIKPGSLGFATMNSDHWATEAVPLSLDYVLFVCGLR
jgi:hypothetical protein